MYSRVDLTILDRKPGRPTAISAPWAWHFDATLGAQRPMWSLWRTPRRRPAPSRAPAGARTFIPRLECLEGRDLLAASVWAYPAQDGHLLYEPTGNGDRIVDFSHAGYGGGTAALPVVPTQIVVPPQAGDDGAAIQNAIHAVAQLPLDENGFRGAVQLTAGEYQIAGTIYLYASGVVLRGAGDGQGGTVLRATGTDPRFLIAAGSGIERTTVPGTQHRIVDKYVPSGARSFRVDSTAGLAVGDTVIVQRPSTAAWIRAIDMDDLTNPWRPGSSDLQFDRVITRIDGNTITLDAPLTNSLDQRYGGGTISEYTWPSRPENIGIEHLRGTSDFAHSTDTKHAKALVGLYGVQNVWVQDVTAEHFSWTAVVVGPTSKWVTIEDVAALDPISPNSGGYRYAFNLEGQLSLVRNAFSEEGRHDFVVGALSTGPNVFLDSAAAATLSDSGPHQRWSTGTLFDNVAVPENQIAIRNRGNSGTGHGWTGANSVVWNSKAKSYVIESPPTAQNWLIGSIGPDGQSTGGAVGRVLPALKDSAGRNVQPRSLYYAQLQDRLADPGSQQREYWIGDIDGLKNNGVVDKVFVDQAWQAAVSAKAKGKVQGFDKTATNTWTAFTVPFGIGAGERVTSASLSLGVRATADMSTVSGNKLYLDSLGTSATVSKLGWGSIGKSGVAGVVVDLTAYLHLLQDGQLNVAVQDDLAIDWAVLNIQVAPSLDLTPTSLAPMATTTVRGGSYENQTLAPAQTLSVQASSTTSNQQAALLMFDLTSFVGPLAHAVLSLPVVSAVAGVENGLSLVHGDWNAANITWNNQPAANKPIASWVPKAGQTIEIALTPLVERALAEGASSLSLKIVATFGSGLATYGPQPTLWLFSTAQEPAA